MKLKHVFFSSLLLSTAFVACTNEEIPVNPSVDVKAGLALGEDFTVVVNGEAESRATLRTNLSPVWSSGDQMGAAWFDMVTALENDGSVKTVQAFDSKKFYSNHPFALTEGAGTNNGKFVAPTNAFAGAYVLYYPYDANFVMTNGEISVKDIPAIQEMNCAPGHELDAVNNNMFVYGVNKLVPGGSQTQEVKLNQLPVLYQVKFKFDEEIRLSLTKPVTIAKVVLEAKDANGTVLTTDGTITPSSEEITKDNYNTPAKDEDGNVIADHTLPAAVYTGAADKTTEHISVNIKNSDKAAYQIAALETLTQKPFIFSALPFTGEADEVTFKIVTTDGLVFARTYEKSDSAEKAIVEAINGTAEAPGAAFQGGQVDLNVTLQVQEEDKVVYTADQFIAKWNAAMKSNSDTEIKIGESLVLDQDLDFNQAKGKAVTVKAACDNHSLTVNNLYATKGNAVIFENPVIVKNEVKTSAATTLEASDLTAKSIEARGQAELAVRKAETMTILSSGIVDLTAVTGDYDGIENIVIESSKGTDGTLNVDDYELDNMTNAGLVNATNVTVTGEVTNEGTIVAENMTNKGTINQKGIISGDLTNAATKEGAVINVSADMSGVSVTNEAATGDKVAGVINISMDSANDVVKLGKGTTNEGIVNVTKGNLTLVAANAAVQNETSTGVINVYKEGTLYARENNIVGGRVYMEDLNATITSLIENKYKYIETNVIGDNWENVPAYADVANIVVDTDLNDMKKIEKLVKYYVVLKAKLTITADLEFHRRLTVDGDATISSNQKDENNNVVKSEVTLTATTNVINGGAKLKLERIDLTGDDDAALTNRGTIELVSGSTNGFKNLN